MIKMQIFDLAILIFPEQRLDAAITRSSQSVGERKRRGSSDEGLAHPMYQQTIHGIVPLFYLRARRDWNWYILASLCNTCRYPIGVRLGV